MQLTFSAHPPFSLSAVVMSHGWAQLLPFDANSEGSDLTRVEQLDSGRVVALLIREAPEGVTVTLENGLRDAERAEVAHKVNRMLGLEQDFSAFYEVDRGEPKLTYVEERAKGRVLRAPTLFEDVVKTILTTNTSWAGTIRMVEGLVSRFGAPLPGDPARHAFPGPDHLAASDEETLRSVGLGYRAPYVLTLAQAVASGQTDLAAMASPDIPTADLRKRLLSIKGVGDYAAAHLLILLGRYDCLPVDSWAREMVSREWHGGEPVGRAEVEAAFARWGEWKGLAYWFWAWDDASP